MITQEDKLDILSIIDNFKISYPSIDKIISNTDKTPSEVIDILKDNDNEGYNKLLMTNRNVIYAVGITEKGILFLIKNNRRRS